MQPGATGPGQDPNQHDPYQPYPPGYGQVPQFPDPLFAPGHWRKREISRP